MMPKANTRAMQTHLDEISRAVARRAHAVLLMDRAGWHTTAKLTVPKNITVVLLPSRSPEQYGRGSCVESDHRRQCPRPLECR